MPYKYAKRCADKAHSRRNINTEAFAGQSIPNSAMLSVYGLQDRAGEDSPDLSAAVHGWQSEPLLGPSIETLRAGTAAPTNEQLGRQVPLEAAMREKMEHAFGMDLSSLKLYESETAAAAGAAAVAQGNRIAFAPGKLDFHSRSGQELLGHEISHIASQARDGVSGRGLLRDSALEAQADREGAMAAAGEQVYSGPVLGTLSAAGPSAAVAGPMQADDDKDNEKQASAMAKLAEKSRGKGLSQKEQAKYDQLLNKSMTDPKMLNAIYQKQAEKRKNEMDKYGTAEQKEQSKDKEKYSSQDRYEHRRRNAAGGAHLQRPYGQKGVFRGRAMAGRSRPSSSPRRSGTPIPTEATARRPASG